jgi:hypothetical protein
MKASQLPHFQGASNEAPQGISPHLQRLNFLSLTPRPVESFLLDFDPIDGERFDLPEPVREAA